MNATEAMSVLARAGRSREAHELVERAVDTVQAMYREIQQDETRTAEFKREEMQRVYEQHRTRLTEKLAELARSSAKSEQSDAVRVFGTAGLSGDPASLMISQRDAVDRVAAIRDRKELSELLARANRVGDEVLARAVAEKALENLDSETLNAFLVDRPHLDAAVQRLWDAARAGSQGLATSMQGTLLLSGMRPPEAALR